MLKSVPFGDEWSDVRERMAGSVLQLVLRYSTLVNEDDEALRSRLERAHASVWLVQETPANVAGSNGSASGAYSMSLRLGFADGSRADDPASLMDLLAAALNQFGELQV